MTLGELIEFLEKQDPDIVVPLGFGEPHSYRGYYSEVSFPPVKNTTIGQMLFHAKSALGETFEGYKGGFFIMTENTDCYIAEYGCTGEMIGPILLGYMAGLIYRCQND